MKQSIKERESYLRPKISVGDVVYDKIICGSFGGGVEGSSFEHTDSNPWG